MGADARVDEQARTSEWRTLREASSHAMPLRIVTRSTRACPDATAPAFASCAARAADNGKSASSIVLLAALLSPGLVLSAAKAAARPGLRPPSKPGCTLYVAGMSISALLPSCQSFGSSPLVCDQSVGGPSLCA